MPYEITDTKYSSLTEVMASGPQTNAFFRGAPFRNQKLLCIIYSSPSFKKKCFLPTEGARLV